MNAIANAMKGGAARAQLELAEARLGDLNAEIRRLENKLRETQNSIADSGKKIVALAARYNVRLPLYPTVADLDAIVAACEAYHETMVAGAQAAARAEAERIAARAGFGRMEGGWA
jgi:hypothetical protein